MTTEEMLRGEDFAHAAEEWPWLISALASHLGVSLLELREMVEQGKVSRSLFDSVALTGDRSWEADQRWPTPMSREEAELVRVVLVWQRENSGFIDVATALAQAGCGMDVLASCIRKNWISGMAPFHLSHLSGRPAQLVYSLRSPNRAPGRVPGYALVRFLGGYLDGEVRNCLLPRSAWHNAHPLGRSSVRTNQIHRCLLALPPGYVLSGLLPPDFELHCDVLTRGALLSAAPVISAYAGAK